MVYVLFWIYEGQLPYRIIAVFKEQDKALSALKDLQEHGDYGKTYKVYEAEMR